MASSLDQLVSALVLIKGVYPCDNVDSITKFDETELPQAFYSKLNDCDISDEDYEHAKKFWNEFKMKAMSDYHDLHLKSDAYLLADVFEEFRHVCLENYELDPTWYFTTPGLAWDTTLKVTNVKLELLRDPDLLLIIDKGIREGI